jgi:hypothetical protein
MLPALSAACSQTNHHTSQPRPTHLLRNLCCLLTYICCNIYACRLLLAACKTAASEQGKLAAYWQRPLLTCKVLELALRANNTADASAFAAKTIMSVAKLCLDAPATAAADQEQVRQVFALSLSCLKLAAAQCCREQQLQAHQQKELGVITSAAVLTALGLERIAQKEQHIPGAAGGDSSGSSSGNDSGSGGSEVDSDSDSDDSSSSSSSSRSGYAGDLPAGISSMLVVLVARSLLLAARPELRTGAGPAAAAAAAGEATAASSSSSAAAPALQITAAAAMLRGGIKDGAYWLARVLPAVELPGGAAASEPAKQQLLQLLDRLLQELQDSRQLSRLTHARRRYNGSTAAVKPTGEQHIDAAAAATLEMLADQAKALGEALCAQLPLAHCCNNPGCVELRGASELQLVGGKGCVCSRCR